MNKKPIQPFRAENEDYVVNEFDKQPIQPFRAESEDYILNEFDRWSKYDYYSNIVSDTLPMK